MKKTKSLICVAMLIWVFFLVLGCKLTCSDSDLVQTDNWCPYFIEALRIQCEAGLLSSDSKEIFQDGYFVPRNAMNIYELTLRDHNSAKISNLEGLQYFINLESFWVHSDMLSVLDLSNNTSLLNVSVRASRMICLDISENYSLQNLFVYHSSLTEIDVSNNVNLLNLYVRYNMLTELDISNNLSLEVLDIVSNKLTTLDVSNNTSLRVLDIRENKMSSPSDVIGWQEIGLSLESDSIRLPSFMFWPQNVYDNAY